MNCSTELVRSIDSQKNQERALVELRSALFQNPVMHLELLEAGAITAQFDSVNVLSTILDAVYNPTLNGRLLSEQLGFKEVGVVSVLTCQHCERSRYAENDDGSKKMLYSPIHIVPLPEMIDNEATMSFSEALTKSLNGTQFECECPSPRCSGKKEHTSKTHFFDLGKKVVFHVGRGICSPTDDGDGVILSKNLRHVSLTETLLLDVEESDNPGIILEKQYVLRQVILHIGATLKRGHYMCVKFENGRWFLFDDNKKRQCLGSTVEQLNAHLASLMLSIC